MQAGTLTALDLWADSHGVVRQMTIQLHGGDGQTTLTVTFSGFGQPQIITAPATSSAVQGSRLSDTRSPAQGLRSGSRERSTQAGTSRTPVNNRRKGCTSCLYCSSILGNCEMDDDFASGGFQRRCSF